MKVVLFVALLVNGLDFMIKQILWLSLYLLVFIRVNFSFEINS